MIAKLKKKFRDLEMNSNLPQVSDIFLNNNPSQYSTSWASKIEARKTTKLPGWTPVRLSGKFRFKKKSAQSFDHDKSNNNEKSHNESKRVSRKNLFPGCTYQFHEYCQHTSLHGFRYVTEERRALSERIFWICWCLFGISSAGYMMSKIWQRWQINPVLTSIATTNHPVSAINFPAVTICTVNKAVSEKLIIQGCRENKTFTEMRQIISTLVDPESRNNVNEQEGITQKETDTKKALRLLRLVAPKCSDFILTCELNSKPRECKELFKLVLTDTGYCCTFNAMDTKSKTVSGDNYTDTEIDQQEREYDVLQKIVWNFTDEFQKQKPADADGNNASLPLPSELKTCNRTYEDELLFKGAPAGTVHGELCKRLQRCREDPGSCGLIKQNDSTEAPPTLGSSSTTSTPGKNGSHLFRAAGAGRRRGLTIITDTLRCAAVPTDSFKGLRIFVHGPDEFPAVGEKGILVGPGQETQIGVTAIDTYSADALKDMQLNNRMCRFANEFPLKYYKEYSRSSCVIQCEHEYILDQCQCVPFYSPAAVDAQIKVCSMEKMKTCVQDAMDNVQRLKGSDTQQKLGTTEKCHDASTCQHRTNFLYVTESKGKMKTTFSFGKPGNDEDFKTCPEQCLPACNETFYNYVVSAAQFPNQNEPNKTGLLKEGINKGYGVLTSIDYVSGSISLLRVFFRESTIMQYKRDELFTWEDFVSNLGGVMSLCLGFSLLSLIEVIYFFTMRRINDLRRYTESDDIIAH